MEINELKLDYFIIWANASENENEIIEIIEKKFEIQRIIRKKYTLFFFYDAYRVYKYSFVPFYYLLKKLFYLRKFPKHMIRSKFQKENSEEHIIHSGNTYYDYLQAKKISKDRKPRYDTHKLTKITIKLENLYCLNFVGDRWNNKSKIIPLRDSCQFKFLNGIEKPYADYVSKFRGTSLKDFYSISKFIKLKNKLLKNTDICENMIVKKIKNKFVILDGTHRSSICLYLKQNLQTYYLYEQ